MKNLTHYSLLSHNTFGIDVPCRRFIEYGSLEEAREVARNLTSKDYPLLILGGGSNLLLTKAFEGTVVHSGISFIRQIDNGRVCCGSGFVWDDFVDFCVSHNLYGTENLSLIPGECGASAVQNIGAYGVEAKDFIVDVEAVEIGSGKVFHFNNSDCEYSYRQSKFKKEWKNKFLITAVTYQLDKTFTPKLDYGNIKKALSEKGISHPSALELRKVIIDIRNAKLPDPASIGNAGSFFMNPIVKREVYEELAVKYERMPHYTIDDAHEKIPAGWLIEQCGWKGKSLGHAGVYEKQSLVLVNNGGATGKEILLLCERIQQDVKAQFGIDINPEVNVI